MVNVFGLRKIINSRLFESGVKNSAFETQEILCFVLNCSKAKLLTFNDTEVSDEIYQRAIEITEKRVTGYPLQYIIGTWDFMGIPLKIHDGVLIFRPDTECICEKAISIMNDRKNVKILDICAGSGCIGISLLYYLDFSSCDFIELYEKPINCIKENLKFHNLESRGRIFQKDVLNGFDFLSEKYDIIISNPPYIEKGDKRLEKNVLKFEPAEALFAKDKGLEFYKSISKNAYDLLKDDGSLIFEIGQGQYIDVLKIGEDAGYKKMEYIFDISDIPRGIILEKK